MGKMNRRLGKQIMSAVILAQILLSSHNVIMAAAVKETPEREIIVAVIDTGIDYDHTELDRVKWVNSDEIPEDGLDNDNNGYIDDIEGWNFYGKNNMVYNSANTYDDHGTHCAGIIAAAAEEDNIKIMSLKVLGGADRSGSLSDVIKAIQYAEKNGADICSMSLGTEISSSKLKKVISKSHMLFLTAAGNGITGGDLDVKKIYPAAYQLKNLISVANCTEEGFLHPTSNYGHSTVTLAAMGTDIYSTLTGSRYGKMTGTSMAAAVVTGAAAHIYSTNPGITAPKAKNAIIQMVENTDELKDKVITGGILSTFPIEAE